MIDRTHSGLRCRLMRHVNSHDGLLRRDTQGTIQYEMDNLDRHLVFVDWDNGMSTLVFSGEVEIDPSPVDVAA